MSLAQEVLHSREVSTPLTGSTTSAIPGEGAQTRATDQRGRTTTETSDQGVHPVSDQWNGEESLTPSLPSTAV